MKELANKALIVLLCTTLLPSVTNIYSVAACLTAITFSSLIFCLRAKSNIYVTILICAYGIISLVCPVFSCFLPLFYCDIVWNKQDAVISFLCLTGAFFSFLPTQTPMTIFYLFLFTILSVLLQHYNQKNTALLADFHRYRDDSTENALLLRQKNEALRIKQDYEIHLATLSERNRIARDIHDNVGHLITRSLLQTGAIQVINQEETLHEPLQNLHETLNTAMTSIRNSVHDLHDESLPLEHVLQKLADSAPTLEVALDYGLEHDVPKELKYSFIAIVREALNNTVKHSNATALSIQVKEHPSLYQLNIQDNGTIPGEIHETGIGLTGMQERIQSLGGTIRFTNENGFRIFISVLKEKL